MKVAYIFSTSGHTASYKLGKMILPQLEEDRHGADVVGMMFFDDNNYILRKGDPVGERLAKVAKEKGILLMMCDQCALERGLAEGEPGNCRTVGTVEGVQVGCFPDLYAALAGNPPDQVITLWREGARVAPGSVLGAIFVSVLPVSCWSASTCRMNTSRSASQVSICAVRSVRRNACRRS